MTDPWKFVLWGGAGLAAYGVLSADEAPRTPNAPTGAPSNTGAPSPPVGGVDDYVRIYIAQRVQAVKAAGEMPGGDSNGKILPVTSVAYAMTQVVAFWQAEVNRLVGFSSSLLPPRRVSLLNRPRSLAEAFEGRFNPLIYQGVVSQDSADALLRAWERAGGEFLRALGQGENPLNIVNAERFWNAVARLAIDVNVDRAVPKLSGLSFAWLALVDSVEELPGRLADAANDAAAVAGGVAGSALTGALLGLARSPVLLGAAAVAAYVYRARLTALYKQVLG